MSETESAPELSFERAEGDGKAEGSEGAPAACGICGQPLQGIYYQMGGAAVCEGCRERKLAERSGGSPVGRFARASLLGTGAAVVGALLWYAVAKLTGYELGLLAIVIGLLVGGAVRLGSRRRGGWLYQSLAMFLTYASIVSTYVPMILEAVESGELAAEEGAVVSTEAATAAAAGSTGEATVEEEAATAAAPAPGEDSAAAPIEAAPAAAAVESEPVSMGIAGLFLGLGALFAIAFAAPFLAGFENFMGWIIIAIGLYEAWKLNRREVLVFEGPFRIGGGRPSYVPEPPPPPIAP
jgi:hypothetical protein